MPQAQIRAFIGRAEGARELLPERPFPDGGTTMLFPRLERAAMNQASDGSATLSRYGIWAQTAHDHVVAAMEHLSAMEVDAAHALLLQVANSLTAFAEVLRILDEERRHGP